MLIVFLHNDAISRFPSAQAVKKKTASRSEASNHTSVDKAVSELLQQMEELLYLSKTTSAALTHDYSMCAT